MYPSLSGTDSTLGDGGGRVTMWEDTLIGSWCGVAV